MSANDAIKVRRSRAIPKEETKVYDLFEKYPNADGKGIKIAILDTGCDLRAAGLNGTTSDGVTPKYIDFLDCTGDGDILMDKSIDFDYTTNQTVKGVLGRNITLGAWAKDITKLKQGAVRLYDLLPRSVERRVKRERKEAFVAKHQALISDIQSKLDNLPENEKVGVEEVEDGDTKIKKEKIGIEKKEMRLLLSELKDMTGDSYKDYGPVLDIIMFEEDGIWKAVLDGIGDVSKSIPMAPFKHKRQTGDLGFGSEVTYCIQVYDKGNILSVVTDAGSHGTHVAGIAAANFNKSSSVSGGHDVNGVAPGAQILALKIGDGRLGSTETGAGLTRALIAAKKYNCDILNLSYGESSWQYNSGRVAKVFRKAVYDWGMAVFTSAGNDGPALSSLGSPGSESAPITVGAWLSPDMMNEQYSTLPPQDGDQPLESGSYYFSSRGPSPDGYLPDICAPGGSIAPIPRHSLQGKAQYHGTSMSSPNAAGVAACILSAVKQQGMNCNPVELKRALINTATPIGIIDSFAQGNGVVQASNCVDYIMATHGKGGQNIEFEVSLPSRNNARGLYIRDESELFGPLTFGVLVKPKFSHSNQRTDSEMEELLNLNLNLKLKASKTWVICPDQITILSAQDRGGQSFSIRLKVEDLEHGVHFATVDAIDDDDLSRGSLFSVPVTVIIPHHSSGEDYSTTFQLTQGRPDRRFLTVPLGAEWATVKLTGNSKKDALAAPRILVHAVPFVRGDLPNSLIQMKKIYQVKEGVEEEFHICVKGGHTLELCLQLLWLANPLPTTVNALIEFHGLDIRSPTLLSSQPVTISSAQQFARLGINTPLRTEKINPTGKFTSVRRTIIPHEYDIKVATNELLDFVPPSDAELHASPDTLYSQMYEMRLTYKFTIKTEKDNKAIPVRPSFPSLFNQLYDSPVDSQLWSLKDSQSQTLTFGGAVHQVQPVSLKKGDYRICLLLRHSERSTLEKLTNIPCELLLTLPDVFPCDIYSELDKASTPTLKDDGRSTIKAVTLKRGSHKDLYVSRPTKDLPSWTEVGDVLVGSLVLDKDNAAVTTLQLLYNVPPKSSVKDAKEDKAAEKKKKDTLDDILFKARLDYTASLRKNNTKTSLEEYEQNLTALIEERPSSVPLLLERLSFSLERTVPSTEEEDKWRAKEVELVYNDMLKIIDLSVLAQYFGGVEPSKEDLEDDEEAKELNKDMKEQRSALKKILLSRALISSKVVEKDDTSSSAVFELDRAVKEMKRWVAKADHLDDDEDRAQLSIILARHAISQDKKSTALSILLKARKDLDGKELKQIDEENVKLYVLFGDMDHLVENMKESIEARYPTKPRKL